MPLLVFQCGGSSLTPNPDPQASGRTDRGAGDRYRLSDHFGTMWCVTQLIRCGTVLCLRESGIALSVEFMRQTETLRFELAKKQEKRGLGK